MGIRYCPRCQTRIMFDENEIDIVHECGNTTASEVLRNEDVIVVGNWEDYTGSGINPSQMVMMQGVGNKLFGTRGWIEGENPPDVTSRGNSTAINRTRNHEEFIELKNGN